ncbi:MAG: hypothetical protein IPM23_17140 [Candidatus Melainabacteria bacterium]|nr:hypothetical protein [Candidatus Melainabacteria bacterium]
MSDFLDTLKSLLAGKEKSRSEDESDEVKEAPSKEELLGTVCHYTCTKMCYGTRGESSQCCKLGNRDFIIGKIHDPERFLKDLEEYLGEPVRYQDVFIDFREGSLMFPERSCWQNPDNYPALRVVSDPKRGFPCRFLKENGMCSVHEIKPQTCRSYYCDYLQDILSNLDEKL